MKRKEEAKQKYEDAIAGGKLGFTAEKKSVAKQEFFSVKIGNLLAGASCTLKI